MLLASAAAGPAWAHKPPDPLHGGQGAGVTVIGHSDLGGAGLNGHLDVLGDFAYVGAGTNGGFAAQWNKTPTCNAASKVKVVSLKDPTDPAVVSTIDLALPGEAPGATLARAVSVINVKPLASTNAFTGDLLAVALESCQGGGRLGVDLYDVSDPSSPSRIGIDTPVIGTATRDVSLVQRPDGRVLALAANQSGGIRVLDVTAPSAPAPIGTFSVGNTTSARGCRPFSFAQGVTTNAAGSRAYAAFGDAGLVTLDISNPMPGSPPPKLAEALYDASEEGNSFRFVPNADETAALATDDDVLPATTTLTVKTGSASAVTETGGSGPGVFKGCTAIWGAGAPLTGPLYRRTATALTDRQVVFVPNGGCAAADFDGLDVEGKIVLGDRGCDFATKARFAEMREAVAVLIGNTSAGQPVFSPDSADAVDAGITIPLDVISSQASSAIKASIASGETVTATLADTPGTWGALRIFNLPSPPANPTQTAIFNAPRTKALTPGNGLYHAVNPLWDGDRALVAWMSDGLRVVDLKDRSAPRAGPFYVPPGVADPTGNYGTVPLVVDVAKLGDRVVVSDINGGLYVLDLRAPSLVGGGPDTGVDDPLSGVGDDLVPGVGAPFTGCPTRVGNVINGSSASNSITGTAGADRIFAGSGGDRVDGLAGADCLDLGAGADRGRGGPDDDLVLGRRGRDRISGSSGSDRLRGGPDRDRISGDASNDTVLGDRGNDVILGGSGNDLLRGVSGRDRLFGGAGRDRISGGSGGDVISASGSNDRVASGPDNDRINGGAGNDVLKGGLGNDRLTGARGRDRISGGGGGDRIAARDGRRERISCGRGRDFVIADRSDRVSRSCERVRRG